MIDLILKSSFKQMPWKNGKGTTTEILILPAGATLQKNDFFFRLSSAPISEDTSFSLFAGKQRILTTIKGAGLQLNSNEYEKFEVASFSGDDKTECKLLKGPVLDYGIVYDPQKVSVKGKVLHLKTGMKFSLEAEKDYYITVLDGELLHLGQAVKELETLHYHHEIECNLQVPKSAVLFYLSVSFLSDKN